MADSPNMTSVTDTVPAVPANETGAADSPASAEKAVQGSSTEVNNTADGTVGSTEGVVAAGESSAGQVDGVVGSRRGSASGAPACDQCRSRKIRCKDPGPTCQICVVRNATCTWNGQQLSPNSNSTPAPAPDPRDEELRLARLEIVRLNKLVHVLSDRLDPVPTSYGQPHGGYPAPQHPGFGHPYPPGYYPTHSPGASASMHQPGGGSRGYSPHSPALRQSFSSASQPPPPRSRDGPVIITATEKPKRSAINDPETNHSISNGNSPAPTIIARPPPPSTTQPPSRSTFAIPAPPTRTHSAPAVSRAPPPPQSHFPPSFALSHPSPPLRLSIPTSSSSYIAPNTGSPMSSLSLSHDPTTTTFSTTHPSMNHLPPHAFSSSALSAASVASPAVYAARTPYPTYIYYTALPSPLSPRTQAEQDAHRKEWLAPETRARAKKVHEERYDAAIKALKMNGGGGGGDGLGHTASGAVHGGVGEDVVSRAMRAGGGGGDAMLGVVLPSPVDMSAALTPMTPAKRRRSFLGVVQEERGGGNETFGAVEEGEMNRDAGMLVD